MTYNRTKFISRWVEKLCALSCTKQPAATAYHPQSSAEVECFRITLAARQCNYVPEHLRDWYIYVQSLKYAYNFQVLRLTNSMYHSLTLSCRPQGLRLSTTGLFSWLTWHRLHFPMQWEGESSILWGLSSETQTSQLNLGMGATSRIKMERWKSL